MSFKKSGLAWVKVPAYSSSSLPGLHQLLELGNDLLPAAISGIVHPVAVMDLLAAVQTQHHIAHLPVGKVDDVVVDEHPIGGQGKAEVLARSFSTLRA